MEIAETRNDGGCVGGLGGLRKFFGLATLALAALLLTGFVTEARAQSGSSTVVVRARGAAGGESITLRVDNSNVATWTLTTTYQTFNATTNLNGTSPWRSPMTAAAATCRWITSSSTARHANRRTRARTPGFTRTELRRRLNSEWMHCNGAITYGPVSQFGQQHCRSRARNGGHRVDQPAHRQYQCRDLDRDDQPAELQRIDQSQRRITLHHERRQRPRRAGGLHHRQWHDAPGRGAELQHRVYANGSCGGGGFSEWMHCNGVIGFGTVSGGGGGGPALPAFFVGNITTNGSVRSDFTQYWNQITPENEGKWARSNRLAT